MAGNFVAMEILFATTKQWAKILLLLLTLVFTYGNFYLTVPGFKDEFIILILPVIIMTKRCLLFQLYLL